MGVCLLFRTEAHLFERVLSTDLEMYPQLHHSWSSRRPWAVGKVALPAAALPDKQLRYAPRIQRLDLAAVPVFAKQEGKGGPPGVPERGKPKVSTGGSRSRPEGPGRGAARPRELGDFSPPFGGQRWVSA